MNKFLVFAFLAFCVIAHPLHRHVKGIVKAKKEGGIFSPHELPCAFQITISFRYEDPFSGEIASSGTDNLYVHGLYFRESYSIKYKSGDTSLTETLGRPDLNETAFGKWFTIKEGSACGSQDLGESVYKSAFKNALATFSNNITYTDWKSAEFEGKPCRQLTLDDYSDMFVDDDDYIIGLQTYSKGGNTYICVMSYNFKVSLHAFVISDEFDYRCSDDSYVAPTVKMCDEPADPSVGSSISVSVAVILISIAAFFLSLV